MPNTHFHPSKRQIMEVQEMVERGWTQEKMRQRIVDPGTGRILTTKAFTKAFGHLFDVDYSRGKESYEPTDKHRKIVALSKLCGITDQDIADMLEISVSTLTKHFAREIKVGRNKLLIKVTDQLVRNAVQHGSFLAQQFILKSQANWLESKNKQEPERPNDAGVLIVPNDTADPKVWEATTRKHMDKIFSDERK